MIDPSSWELQEHINRQLSESFPHWKAAPKFDPDRQCTKCGAELIWVRMSLNCPHHGPTGKGC